MQFWTLLTALASPEAHGGVEWFGDGPADDGKTAVIILVINFVALLLILNKLLFQNLRSRNAEVSDAIRLELEKATSARAAAETLMREYETKLQALESEVEDIRSQARGSAEAEYARIIAEANDQAIKIKSAAERAGEREGLRRRAELEREIVDQALARAETAIRSSFGSADQRRLVDAWVDEVGKADLQMGKVN
jgi:F0F1-type ATP synthase membrane subunit b/b'